MAGGAAHALAQGSNRLPCQTPSRRVATTRRAPVSAQPLPTEYAVVSTMDEAERWAARRLAAAGLTVPAGVAS